MKLLVLISIIIIIMTLLIVMILMIVRRRRLLDYVRHTYISSCYNGGGEDEWAERDVAYKYTDKNANVLEFGGGSGSVSQVVQRVLNDPSKHVVIQPNDDGQMFGGFEQITKNKNACNSSYNIIDHVLSVGEGVYIKDHYIDGANFDLIIADCENCLLNEYYKNPELFEGVKMIQVERDDVNNSYNELFRILNMKKIYTGFHPGLSMEVWTR